MSIHWVPRGTGTPIDKDEVNRQDVCECDALVCVVLEVIAPINFGKWRSSRIFFFFKFCLVPRQSLESIVTKR